MAAPQAAVRYKPLPTRSDLSTCSLEWAILRLFMDCRSAPRRPTLVLKVAQGNLKRGQDLISLLAPDAMSEVSAELDESLAPEEWFVELHDDSLGLMCATGSEGL